MFYEFKHLGSPDYLKIEKGDNFSFPVHLHQCIPQAKLQKKSDITAEWSR